jgi:hypothetical protein
VFVSERGVAWVALDCGWERETALQLGDQPIQVHEGGGWDKVLDAFETLD